MNSKLLNLGVIFYRVRQLTMNMGHSGQAAGGGMGRGDPPPTGTTSGIWKQLEKSYNSTNLEIRGKHRYSSFFFILKIIRSAIWVLRFYFWISPKDKPKKCFFFSWHCFYHYVGKHSNSVRYCKFVLLKGRTHSPACRAC